MSITTDRAGRVVAGRYQLVAQLGRGSFAVVFLAEDLRLSRPVAVKLLHPGLAADEAFSRRFRAEAELLGGLNHPRVMSVFDWGEEHGDAYLVSEYLAGGSLAAMLRRGTVLGVPEAVALGAKVANGLAHAHRRGLVHRDIKPANLLFDDSGEVRIADFGVACAIAEVASTQPQGALVGTARYAAPEQAEGRPLDGRTDVYALGLVLYEAVTGTLPFVGETDAATLLRRVGATLPPSRALGPLYPLLAQATIADPLARLDAAELQAELETLARALPAPRPLAIERSFPGGPEASGALRDLTSLVVPRPVEPDPLDEDRTRAEMAGDDMTLLRRPAEAATAPRHAHRRRGLIAAVAAAIVVVLGLVAGALSYDHYVVYGHHVPGVSGMTVAKATSYAKRAGLTLVIGARGYSSSEPRGAITAQVPPAGRAVRSGTTVTVTVSRGPRPIAIPVLVAKSRAAAVAALVEAHLVPVVSTTYSETVRKGRVVSEAPSSGHRLPGAVVVLEISLGPAPRTIPELPGATWAAADAALSKLRLVPSEQLAFSTTVPAGQVISTSPAEGAGGVPVGSAVAVAVSKGPQLVTVPAVDGLSVTAAVALLEADGLKVTEEIGPPFATTAVTTNPVAGSAVALGSAVTIYVS